MSRWGLATTFERRQRQRYRDRPLVNPREAAVERARRAAAASKRAVKAGDRRKPSGEGRR
jgi:hypothetical protein